MNPLLSCMSFPPWFGYLIITMVIAWWISGGLALVNLSLAVNSERSPEFKIGNLGFWALYMSPGLLLLLGAGEWMLSWFMAVYAIAIPFITIGHFIFLRRARRKNSLVPEKLSESFEPEKSL